MLPSLVSETIAKRIAELEQERQQYRQEATAQLAAYDGAITELGRLRDWLATQHEHTHDGVEEPWNFDTLLSSS